MVKRTLWIAKRKGAEAIRNAKTRGSATGDYHRYEVPLELLPALLLAVEASMKHNR